MQTKRPSDSADSAKVTQRYDALVASGKIERDSAQTSVVAALDALAYQLEEHRIKHSRVGLRYLLGREKNPGDKQRGMYIFGSVGRGKTMLMNLFFECVTLEAKCRVHFHQFMADVHDRMQKAREKIANGSIGDVDALALSVRSLAKDAKLLCIDELAVTDIADAMLLGRVLTELFAQGVMLVVTSNVEPDRLYEGNPYRRPFLPFIALLKEHVDVVELKSRTDFRLEKLQGECVWYMPADAVAKAELDRIFTRFTNGVSPESLAIPIGGRTICVPLQAGGVARFTFRELCLAPLGPSDYIAIARKFHTLILDAIPAHFVHRNHVKRFCALIDVIYEHNVRLIVSADTDPDGIYRGMAAVLRPAIGPVCSPCVRSPETLEFKRMVSRLIDMRSRHYLDLAGNRADQRQVITILEPVKVEDVIDSERLADGR